MMKLFNYNYLFNIDYIDKLKSTSKIWHTVVRRSKIKSIINRTLGIIIINILVV